MNDNKYLIVIKWLKRCSVMCFGVLLYLLSACDVHSSDNGSMDGFWQLTVIDTLENGHSADVRDKRIFWAIQASLLEMRDMRERFTADGSSVFFRFSCEEGHLHLSSPSVNQRNKMPEYPDKVIDDPLSLAFYGLNSLEESFEIVMLDNGTMILQNQRYRFHFRQY